MNKIQSYKRHFQLLELMVAAFILLICIAPTMRIFTSMYQSQQEVIRENQRDHLAHMVHAQVVQQLYKRQIIFERGEQDKPIPLSDPELLQQLQRFGYESEGILTIVDFTLPKGKEYPSKYLGKLTVKLKDVSLKAQSQACEGEDPKASAYDFFVYIDAGYKEKEREDEKEEEPLAEKKKETTSEEEEEDEDDFFDEDEEEDDEDDEDDDEDDF